MAKSCPIVRKSNMGSRERRALAKVLRPLVREGICTIAYDSYHDVFYFRGKSKLAKDVREGFVLSVSDAQHGNWRSIYEPPNF